MLGCGPQCLSVQGKEREADRPEGILRCGSARSHLALVLWKNLFHKACPKRALSCSGVSWEWGIGCGWRGKSKERNQNQGATIHLGDREQMETGHMGSTVDKQDPSPPWVTVQRQAARAGPEDFVSVPMKCSHETASDTMSCQFHACQHVLLMNF